MNEDILVGAKEEKNNNLREKKEYFAKCQVLWINTPQNKKKLQRQKEKKYEKIEHFFAAFFPVRPIKSWHVFHKTSPSLTCNATWIHTIDSRALNVKSSSSSSWWLRGWNQEKCQSIHRNTSNNCYNQSWIFLSA